jgi:hypothetical protein
VLAVSKDPHELLLLIVCGMPGDGAMEIAAFWGGGFEDEGTKLVDFAVGEEEVEEGFCREEARDADEEFLGQVE